MGGNPLKNSIILKFLVLAFMLLGIEGCSFSAPKKKSSNIITTRKEQIEFHKGQIERYKEALQKEEDVLSKALTEQKMNDIRTSNLKKERYLLRLQQHMDKLKELEEVKG
jgi:exopolysaccharide biosynthesis protein